MQRPIPDDFTARAATMTRTALERHYRCGNITASRWYKEAGIATPRANIAAIAPSRISEVRAMVHAGKSATEIASAMNASKKAVILFVNRNKLGPWRSKNGMAERAVPANFATVGPTMPRVEAQAHYKCGAATLTRWYAETGVKPALRASTMIVAPSDLKDKVAGMNIKEASATLGINRKAAARIMRDAGLAVGRVVASEVKAKAKPLPFKKPMGSPTAPIVHYQRDMSIEGQAQDLLQNDRWVVFRCNEFGQADAAGKFWVCGGRRVTGSELIERAERAARRMGRVIPWRMAA